MNAETDHNLPTIASTYATLPVENRRIYFLAQDFFVARERMKLAVKRTRIPRDGGAPRASKAKSATDDRESHRRLMIAIGESYRAAGGDEAYAKLPAEWQRNVRKYVRAVIRNDREHSARGCLCEVHRQQSHFHPRSTAALQVSP